MSAVTEYSWWLNRPGAVVALGAAASGASLLLPTTSGAAVCSVLGGALLGAGVLSTLLSRDLSLRAQASNSTKLGSWTALEALLAAAKKPATDALEKAQVLERKLAEAESRHRLLTDNIAAAVVLRDNSRRIVYCSPYTEVLTGYPARDILACPEDFFSTVVPDEDRERYERAFQIGALGDAFQVRHRLIHRTGIEMWVETRTVPILDQHGEVSQSLSVTLDVTGAVRYQRQVEEKNRDLHDFAYMVSHDLKGPIMTVKGMLGVLEEDVGTQISAEAKETLGHIRTATQRLEQLVAGVLEYSKISAQGEHAESVDLGTVLQEVRQHLKPQLDALGASISLDAQYPKVVGEHVWLYQVFSNLLGNAIKYREHSRPLRVSVTHSTQPSGREVVIAVQDNGLGIPADKINNLFRPFQRAHGRSIEGTGIGLASVKRVLEKCGGSVRVESTEGQGSTFYVTLRAAR